MLGRVWAGIISRLAHILLGAILVALIAIYLQIGQFYIPRNCGSQSSPCKIEAVELTDYTIRALAEEIAKRSRLRN